MEYHKDQFTFTDRMEYLRAPLVVQAAHQWLIRYCARRENGGIIADCKAWKDREWGIATNGQLRAREVAAVVAAGLATFDTFGALLIHGYDLVGQDECLRNRQRVKDWKAAQRAAGKSSGEYTGTGTATDEGTRTPTASGTGPVQTRPVQTRPSSTPTPPPVDPGEVVEEAPALRFIQSRGGYLHHHGEDRRPGWLADIEGLTLEQIGEVFTWSKARGQIVVYPGKGPGYFGGALAAMREAQRAEAAKQRLRMEAEANRAIHEQEASQKTKQAAAIDARNRSLVSGILATYDESPARWSSVITEAQAKLLNDLRATHDAGRPLGLLVRHLEGMPRDLVEAGTARGREMHEQTEGATA